MLVRLSVQNYALIRELNMEPGGRLTIITGETGAGKSILLGALSLILGNRADTSVLLNKDEKCVVEGLFNLAGKEMEIYFGENDLDYDDNTILRREINPAGKSRAFVNDTPVNLNILRDIGDRLVDIHSQHNNLLLNDSAFQLGVIDSVAGNSSLLHSYREVYEEYRQLRKEYDSLKENTDRNKADLEYYQFQLTQLKEAALVPGEQQGLEQERETLAHAGDIRLALGAVTSALSSDDISALKMIRDARSALQRVAGYIGGGDEMLARLESAGIELDDIAATLSQVLNLTEDNPQRLQIINDRLDQLNALMHKHRVNTLEELIEKAAEIEKLVTGIETGDERLIELEPLLKLCSERLASASRLLTESRSKVTGVLESTVAGLLKSLGIPNARFSVRLSAANGYMPTGDDRAEFLFSANRQVPPETLSRVASGGELSRVMLSLKYLLSKSRRLPSVIFDEIDSGVSGEVAGMVGDMLAQMGKTMQVINITHLPQIAALGDTHYFVYKNDTSDSTITHLKLLSKEERVMEVARLLSGSEITDAAVEHARTLFKKNI
ncbi:MAG: DNA repair protein RecN [Bacteroidetes bacterium]|nr:DNA repair protein RecN [Bacteroidota bacterium]